MKLNQQTTILESSGITNTEAFKIKASPKVFAALSSTIYQDKILAIVRELTCNMSDAHRSIGQTKPFEIKLPNWADNQIIFKDYGPGLSHQQVTTLYTTYFDSTKDGSNDFIGGFGIGSKAPFCYVDQFNVESRHGGEARRYICYSDGGQPKLTYMGSSPASDTGLTISIATNSNDAKEFARKVSSVLFWFSPSEFKVTGVPGFEVPTAKWREKNKDWGSIDNLSSYSARFGVLCGNVYYPIDYNAIPNFPYDLKFFADSGVVLFMPIGSISPALSRESLSYDDMTCKNIVSFLRRIHAEFSKEYQTGFSSCKTAIEAAKYYFSLNQTIARTVFGSNTPLWNGIDVSWIPLQFKTRLNEPDTTALYSFSDRNFRRRKNQNWAESKIDDPKSKLQFNLRFIFAPSTYQTKVTLKDSYMFVWVEDIDKAKYKPRINEHFKNLYANSFSDAQIYVCSGGKYDDWLKDITDLGFPASMMQKADDFLTPLNAFTVAVKNKYPPVKAYSGMISDGALRITKAEQDFDLSSPGYYGYCFDGEIIQSNFGPEDSKKALYQGISDTILKVFGFDTTKQFLFLRPDRLGPRVEERFKKSGWVSIRNHIQAQPRNCTSEFKNALLNYHLNHYLTTVISIINCKKYNYNNSFNINNTRVIIKELDLIKDLCPKFKKIYDDITLKDTKLKFSVDSYHMLIKIYEAFDLDLSLNDTANLSAKVAAENLKEFFIEKPLLSMIFRHLEMGKPTDFEGSLLREHLVNYLNTTGDNT